jgi:hypothetical protein
VVSELSESVEEVVIMMAPFLLACSGLLATREFAPASPRN